VSADPASDFASRFACRATDTADDADSEVEPGNVAGFCDQRLESTVRALLTGERSVRGALDGLEPRLWQENVTIPLYQLADTLAVGDDVAGVTEGPPLAGPFGAAVNWIRISQ
ncbi:MAG: ABC transporter family substrate-binding protein, partial [Thermocrispum sp.]